jgi:hypothetical protein
MFGPDGALVLGGPMKLNKGAAVAVACCWLISGVARDAGAQMVASSFDQLGGRLKTGRTVVITEEGGRKTTGAIADLSESSLKLLVNGREQEFDGSRVRQITERRRNTAFGAANGLAVGAVLGVIVGAMAPECFGCSKGGLIAVGALMLGGMGAGAGAAIGAATTSERLVYRPRPQPASTLVVAPFVSAQATGVRASLRF